MNPDEIPLESPIEKKIAWARACYDRHGKALESDAEISALLAKLCGATEASREAMIAAGMVKHCRHCEEEDGGSCCGAGLENKYDAVLLLINLLLGKTLPDRRQLGRTSCYFLGSSGCTLQARQVICVHYLCDLLQVETPPELLSALQAAEGTELELLFQVHDRIIQRLRKEGDRS